MEVNQVKKALQAAASGEAVALLLNYSSFSPSKLLYTALAATLLLAASALILNKHWFLVWIALSLTTIIYIYMMRSEKVYTAEIEIHHRGETYKLVVVSSKKLPNNPYKIAEIAARYATSYERVLGKWVVTLGGWR